MRRMAGSGVRLRLGAIIGSNHILRMAQFKVLGEGGAQVDVLGETKTAGDVVELEQDAAQPLVDEGKLEAVQAEG